MEKQTSRWPRRKLLASVAGGIGAVLLAACAQPQPTPAPGQKPAEAKPAEAKPAAPAKGQIKFSVWGDIQDKDVYDNISNDFNAAQQNVKAVPEQWVGQFYEKLQTVLAGGTAPDITYAQGWRWQPFAVRGVFVDLNSYKQRDSHTAPWPDFENYKNQTQFRGKLTMQPSDTGGMVIFYNKTQFDKMKLPYPTGNWTYEQFVETAKKLTSTSGERSYGYQMNGGYLRNIPWIRMHGDLEWDTLVEPKKALWDNKNIIDALQWQQFDSINTLKVSPSPAEMTGGANQIQSGNVAMKMEGPWFLPQMQGPQAKRQGGTPFDVVLLPIGPNGKRMPHVGLVHGHCMIAQSKNQDGAWEFLKYVAGDKGQQRIAEGGRQPMTPDTIRKYWLEPTKKQFNFQNAEAFAEALEVGGVSVVGEIDEGFLWNEVLKEAWDAMQGGLKKASEVIPEANKKIQKILDEYWAKQK